MCRIQDNYVHEYQAIRNHLSWTQELRRYKREASNMFELPHRQHGRGYSSISKSNEFTETSRLLFVIRIFALSAPIKLGRVSEQQGAALHFSRINLLVVRVIEFHGRGLTGGHNSL